METLLKLAEQELRLKNYSPKTRKSYIGCIRQYLTTKSDHPEKVDIEHIREFLLLKMDSGQSSRTANVYLHAIRFFYKNVLKISCPIQIPYAKTPQSLPIILSRLEIQHILEAIENLKHKTLCIAIRC